MRGIPVAVRVPADKTTSTGFLHGIRDDITDADLLRAVRSPVPVVSAKREASKVTLRFDGPVPPEAVTIYCLSFKGPRLLKSGLRQRLLVDVRYFLEFSGRTSGSPPLLWCRCKRRRHHCSAEDGGVSWGSVQEARWTQCVALTATTPLSTRSAAKTVPMNTFSLY
ncbi:hypothetical protein HPB50_008272 [Hyalomma asiaticum]|uniref:Uncharacterized protein n=1 Tax=Hyalomma asiaticum TaxID=266040 RepID=A0ACB7RN91_HYAAI|nr:hypothetical protein HPB50_008272 [Hyalomma asiaticum]